MCKTIIVIQKFSVHSVRIFIPISSLFFLLNCAANSGNWNVTIIFVSESIKNNRLSTDNSILILPIIKDTSFKTSFSHILPPLLDDLEKIQKNSSFYYINDLDSIFTQKHSKDTVEVFYKDLINSNILSLTKSDSLWLSIPYPYVMVIRLITGSRINSFDGILKMKAVLEIELWNTSRYEIVWHAKSSGYEMKPKTTDNEFIAKGIKSIVAQLPPFFRAVNEINW